MQKSEDFVVFGQKSIRFEFSKAFQYFFCVFFALFLHNWKEVLLDVLGLLVYANVVLNSSSSSSIIHYPLSVMFLSSHLFVLNII